LAATGSRSRETLLEKGAADVEVGVDEGGESVAMDSVSVVGASCEGEGCVVGSGGIGGGVGVGGLLVAAGGEPSGNATVAFKFDKHEGGDAEGVNFDRVGRGDGADGVVDDGNFRQFRSDSSVDFGFQVGGGGRVGADA
jgi:hypothetical protein